MATLQTSGDTHHADVEAPPTSDSAVGEVRVSKQMLARIAGLL
jgi:hypothetical protein